MTDEDAIEVGAQYGERFGVPPPQPYGVDNTRYISVLRQAMRDGKPLDDEFDWWSYLPPDAVA